MRDDITSKPISEVFEPKDGCPVCRMRDMLEERSVTYITGAAMMEPDVRIATNKVGFCQHHYDKMLSTRGRLQLSLMLQTHIDEINKGVFTKNIFTPTSKKGSKAAKISESCFICDKIEFGLSRMIETIYRTYETERDFREMFDNQPMFCLPHYERLMAGIDKKEMRSYGSDFAKSLTRITSEHAKTLYKDLSDYCAMYDYRANKEEVSKECKESVERTIAFLNGRYYE